MEQIVYFHLLKLVLLIISAYIMLENKDGVQLHQIMLLIEYNMVFVIVHIMKNQITSSPTNIISGEHPHFIYTQGTLNNGVLRVGYN